MDAAKYISPEAIFSKIRLHYLASFTWERQRHFWPVYLFWLLFFLRMNISLFIFARYLRPYDFTAQAIAWTELRFTLPEMRIAMDFFMFLSFLQCPYFLILKRYSYAAQAALYFIGIYFGVDYMKGFAYAAYGFINQAIVCPASKLSDLECAFG